MNIVKYLEKNEKNYFEKMCSNINRCITQVSITYICEFTHTCKLKDFMSLENILESKKVETVHVFYLCAYCPFLKLDHL